MQRRGSFPATLSLVVVLSLPVGQWSPASDWLQFRGSDSSGVSDERGLPLRWSEGENIAWRLELPGRGVSSPIVVKKSVILTSSSGFRQDRLHVLCFDADTGEKRWERQFWATGQTQCHPKTCMAAPTPASDGERIFALFSSNDLFCLDLRGHLLWLRGLTHDYPNASNSIGMASSPLAVGETVVVQVENDTDSFVAGLDVTSGVNRWKISRPAKVNWTSPLRVRRPDGRADAVVLQSMDGLSAHDPADGRRLWAHEAPSAAIASSTVANDVLYLPSGGLTALRPSGGSSPPRVLWQSKRLRLSTASPVVYGGRAYALTGSILRCARATDGELLWQLRLKGPFSSSPVAAGGYLYLFNEKGLAQVVRVGDEGELVGTSDLGETILCTPAVARRALFVRSDRHLWRIGT